jgi:hypothetical protein
VVEVVLDVVAVVDVVVVVVVNVVEVVVVVVIGTPAREGSATADTAASPLRNARARPGIPAGQSFRVMNRLPPASRRPHRHPWTGACTCRLRL